MNVGRLDDVVDQPINPAAQALRTIVGGLHVLALCGQKRRGQRGDSDGDEQQLFHGTPVDAHPSRTRPRRKNEDTEKTEGAEN